MLVINALSACESGPIDQLFFSHGENFAQLMLYVLTWTVNRVTLFDFYNIYCTPQVNLTEFWN